MAALAGCYKQIFQAAQRTLALFLCSLQLLLLPPVKSYMEMKPRNIIVCTRRSCEDKRCLLLRAKKPVPPHHADGSAMM